MLTPAMCVSDKSESRIYSLVTGYSSSCFQTRNLSCLEDSSQVDAVSILCGQRFPTGYSTSTKPAVSYLQSSKNILTY